MRHNDYAALKHFIIKTKNPPPKGRGVVAVPL